MLERYFVRPQTVDGIRGSWIGPAIEQYVSWLSDRGYAARSIHRRVPILRRFGEFAYAHGARTVEELPVHVGSFVEGWLHQAGGGRRRSEGGRREVAKEIRGPVEQMLRLAAPDFVGTGRPRHDPPFTSSAPESVGQTSPIRPVNMRPRGRRGA